jgi:ribosomal protein S2
MQKQIDKLDKFIGGIAPITRSSIAGRYANNVNLNNAIGLMIVDDYVREKNAIIDAKKLGIPVVALGNSNCFPGDNVDFFIPCNTNSYHTI